MTWNQRLMRVKEATGWTYSDLAEFLGQAKGTVHGWATGERDMPDAVKAWIAEIERVLDRQNAAERRRTAEKLLNATVMGAGAVLLGLMIHQVTADDDEKKPALPE